MNFKEWLQNGDGTELSSFFMQVRTYVLNHTQDVNGDYLALNFPKNYEAYMPAEERQPMRLAASAINPGNPLSEGGLRPGASKGKYITNMAMKQMANTTFAQQMTPKNLDALSNRITKSLKDVAKEIGYLFELQVYVYLVDNIKLKPTNNHDSNWARTQIKTAFDELTRKLGAKGHAISWFTILTHHAEGMARDIASKANRMLKSNAGQVTFLGGGGLNQTADIQIERVGFSLKYATETIVGVKELSYGAAYSILGGKDDFGFMSSISGEDAPQVALKEFEELAKAMNSDQVGYLYSYLLSGKKKSGAIDNVYPAFMNYRTGQSNVGHSGAMQNDFDIRGTKMMPKKSANIEVRRTGIYLVIRVEGGSQFGTKIQIEPKATGYVIFKMTNLVQEK